MCVCVGGGGAGVFFCFFHHSLMSKYIIFIQHNSAVKSVCVCVWGGGGYAILQALIQGDLEGPPSSPTMH